MTTISDQFTAERRARLATFQRPSRRWSMPLWYGINVLIWAGALTLWTWTAIELTR
jgi:hypothetical protein